MMRMSWLMLSLMGLFLMGEAQAEVTANHNSVSFVTIADAQKHATGAEYCEIEGVVEAYPEPGVVKVKDETGEITVLVPMEMLAGHTPYKGCKVKLLGRVTRGAFEGIGLDAERIHFDSPMEEKAKNLDGACDALIKKAKKTP